MTTEGLTEREFERVADESLRALEGALEDLDGLEVSLEMGILTLEFADGTRYVINSHRAARQIWMAAELRAWHFDYQQATRRWIAGRDGDELWSALAGVTSRKLGRPVSAGAIALARATPRRSPWRRMHRVLTIAAAALVLLGPRAAGAYCQSATCAVGGEGGSTSGQVCDPALPTDCGTPLQWRQPCVSFDVQQGASSHIDFATADATLTQALAAWTAVRVRRRDAEHPGVRLRRGGL